MNFCWEDYHDLACELANEHCPAKKRTSINRSYYSAYCVARDFLIDNQTYLNKKNKEIINSKSSKAHNEVNRVFHELYQVHKKGNKKIGYEIYLRLNRLRNKRNIVDYELDESDLNMPNLKSEAEKCILDSKYVLNNLDKFL
ncbi:MAG: hypothetical protein LBT66_08115 [Methanobrevibacter sp.]|jgi:hypothetical protein|nr:hypothetical protein [Candidatus Methanovirga meridionalis]